MQLLSKSKHLNTRDGQGESHDILQLVAKASKGDRKAQKAIYDSLSGKMYAVCLRYMADRESALDVLQDAFVSLFTKLDSFSGEGSFEGWARKIFVNTALMSLRKRDILRQTEDVETAWNVPSTDPGAIRNIGYSELLKLISELPPGFRTVFNMYVMEGYSHKEIADMLGISEVTSRSQLQRARTLLQTRINSINDVSRG